MSRSNLSIAAAFPAKGAGKIADRASHTSLRVREQSLILTFEPSSRVTTMSPHRGRSGGVAGSVMSGQNGTSKSELPKLYAGALIIETTLTPDC